jgi:GT2 family glycosyltransferase
MTATPRVSVVIPAYRSGRTLQGTLDALRVQRFRDFETIVVDSSPDQATEDVVRTHFPEVTLERSAQRLPPHAARNRGVERARGELLVFTDADTRPRPDWLSVLVAAHERDNAIVGGAVDSAEQSWFARGVHVCKFGSWLDGSPAGVRPLLPTANLLLSRLAWEAVGPFPVLGWSGDADLCWRARAAGYSLAFEPAAVVGHEQRTSLARFWAERVERGYAFGVQRVRTFHWSRARAGAYLVAAPLIAVALLARGVRAATRAMGLRIGLGTAPVQAIGYVGWSVGEARAHAQAALRPKRRGNAP